MSMPYLTVSSLSSTTLVVKQSQFHCRIVRRCLFCSGISVMRSTATGWLVALCTDAQRWQVHASAAPISAEPVGFPWHTSHGTAAGMLRRQEDFELELGISCTRGTFLPSSHAEVQQVRLTWCLVDQSNGAVRVSKSVGASGSRDGCLLRCSFGKRRCFGV